MVRDLAVAAQAAAACQLPLVLVSQSAQYPNDARTVQWPAPFAALHRDESPQRDDR